MEWAEEEHVHHVYQQIAHDFDRTRYALWPRVVSFLQDLPSGSKILDIGCGNGKYLSIRAKDCEIHACDPCAALVTIAQRKHPSASIVEANGLCLPYDTNSFDAVMSIAVLHHVSTFERRCDFLREMIRVLKPGGKGHITVWAVAGHDDQNRTQRDRWISLGDNDYMVPWRTVSDTLQRYYHLFTMDNIWELIHNAMESCSITSISKEKENWHVAFYKEK